MKVVIKETNPPKENYDVTTDVNGTIEMSSEEYRIVRKAIVDYRNAMVFLKNKLGGIRQG